MHSKYTPSTPQVRVSRCATCTRGVLKYILAYEYQFEGQVYTSECILREIHHEYIVTSIYLGFLELYE